MTIETTNSDKNAEAKAAMRQHIETGQRGEVTLPSGKIVKVSLTKRGIRLTKVSEDLTI